MVETPLSPAASPPEVQEIPLSPPAPLPTTTTPPPLLTPISPEASPPPPLYPALPPELPPPTFPATPPPPISPEFPPELPSPNFPATSPPPLFPAFPPELPPPNIPATSPPPLRTKTPPEVAPPPATPLPISSITSHSPPLVPKSPIPVFLPPPPHSKLPELSQPPPSRPKHLPSPELKTHLPIASPQNSSDPKFLSAPPSTTPSFFPSSGDPPPPPPPLAAPPPTLSSSDISTTIGNQTTLNSKQPHFSTGVILGSVIGGVLLIAVLGVLYLFCRNRKNPKRTENGKPWLGMKETSSAVRPQHWQDAIVTIQANSQSGSQHPFPRQNLAYGTFTYDELEMATNGFSKVNLLGEGGFGYVHRGVLLNGKEVAVKKLKTRSKQGEREFQAEVETFSQVHHKHLVTLVGYCITGSERLLVYEFVPNKTLEFHLHGKDQHTMEWATRLKIAVGSAKGLAYLHEDCNPTIIHRDIKAANILLDFKFDAKVSDFGLAKFFTDKSNASCITHISTRVVGTFGYLAPEYASSGKVTEKSDVYSFGVMLLELITGCPPICRTQEPTMSEGLVGWARPLLTQAHEDGNYDTLADPNLHGNYNAGEMASMVACAAACVRHSAWLRPRMSQIVRTLEGDMSPADLNEGPIPGHSTIYGASQNSSTYDAYHYKEDLKKYNMALASLEQGIGIGRYSGSTSENGQNQSGSGSSCEMQRST